MGKLAEPLLEFAMVIKEKGLVPNKDLNIRNNIVRRFVRLAKKVPDKRLSGMIVYPLEEILLVAFFAVLSGANTFMQISDFGVQRREWLLMFSKFENGIPSHDTFRRVFSLIEPGILQSLTVDFLMKNMNKIKSALKLNDDKPRLINIDGKQARGTGRSKSRNGVIPNLQTLNVYDASSGICIAMECINNKTNEIPTAQALLPFLDINKAIVTCDALNTQKKTIEIIASKEKNGEYVAALKGNQHLFYDEVVTYFSKDVLQNIKSKKVCFYSTSEKSHSQYEVRNYYLSTNIKWFAEYDKWKKLRAFICYEKVITDAHTGEIKTEYRYFISSIKDVELCAAAIRGHWAVENRLHWHLDYSFSDDYDTNTFKNAYLNFTLFRRMALTLCKMAQPFVNKSINRIRYSIALNPTEQLGLILGTLDEDNLEEALRNANKK